MSPAIIAAVKVCIAVMFYDSNANAPMWTRWHYPAGYEQCPDLVAEERREQAEAAQARNDADDKTVHDIYERGVSALPK